MMLDETQIASRMRCPLADFRQDIFIEAIQPVVKSLVLAASDLRIPQLKTARTQLSSVWEKKRAEINCEEVYIEGHKKIPGIARRLVSVFRDYQITVNPAKYDLRTESGHVQVEYAVAKKWKNEDALYCLSFIRSKAPQYYDCPEPVSLARWFHLKKQFPYRDVRILHVPLLNGYPWITKGLDHRLVGNQLNKILRSVSVDEFPRSGPHCENCMSRKCKEIIRDR